MYFSLNLLLVMEKLEMKFSYRYFEEEEMVGGMLLL